MMRRLAALLFVGVLAGCPRPAPPPRPGPSRPGSWRATVDVPTEEPPLAARPALREPPFHVAIALEDARRRAPTLAASLDRALRRSTVFVPLDRRAQAADEPGGAALAAHTLVRIVVAAADGAAITAQLTITLPGAGSDEATARETLSAPSARRLALKLAAAIHRHHLDYPGPFLEPIAFAAKPPDAPGRRIYVVDFDGEGLRAVATAGALNLLPGWSERGELLYTTYAGRGPQLALHSAIGAAPRLLPIHGTLNSGAAFAPDGERIAVTISREGNADIHVIDRAGALREQITRHRALDISPSWSPDGRRIAFVSERDGTPQIYVTDVHGGRPRRLTFAGTYNQEPAWCPQPGSTRIAYTQRHPGERYAIHVVDAHSGVSKPLTSPEKGTERPSWSTDCRLLIFGRGTAGLWLVDAEGHEPVLLRAGNARTPAWAHAPQRTPR